MSAKLSVFYRKDEQKMCDKTVLQQLRYTILQPGLAVTVSTGSHFTYRVTALLCRLQRSAQHLAACFQHLLKIMHSLFDVQ